MSHQMCKYDVSMNTTILLCFHLQTLQYCQNRGIGNEDSTGSKFNIRGCANSKEPQDFVVNDPREPRGIKYLLSYEPLLWNSVLCLLLVHVLHQRSMRVWNPASLLLLPYQLLFVVNLIPRQHIFRLDLVPTYSCRDFRWVQSIV